MYVTVSLTIELEATATLSQLESQVEEAGRAAMRATLQHAIQQQEAQETPCPRCGSDQSHTQGTKRRVLLTRFGRVDVPLKRRRCLTCRCLFRPAASYLAEVQGYYVTPALRDLAALVGSAWPYATATGVLKRLSGVQLSDERLRQLTNEQGSCLAGQQEEVQQALEDASNLPLIRRERALAGPAAPSEPPEWLQVGCDGGWVHSREQQGGMEGKIGVVASQIEPVGKHGRHRLSSRRYGATFGSAEEVGRQASAAACDL